ncbi:MAG: tetratricopeptide repeat protein [Candidatus Omnitrophota bacterium]
MPQTTLRQKLFLICFGLFLAIAFLEIALRIGGFAFLFFQESLNRASACGNGEYRILCLGESTTALGGAHAYPRQLEEILNAKNPSVRFSVINKGVPAMNTYDIVSYLETWIDEYHPKMIVTMMGINDSSDTLRFKAQEKNLQRSFLDGLKVYKLARLIWSHAEHKKEELIMETLERKVKDFEKKISLSPSSEKYMELGRMYKMVQKFDKEKEAYLRAIELDGNNAQAYFYLGLYYREWADYKKGEDAFKKVIELGKLSDEHQFVATYQLANCYKMQAKYSQAENLYKRILAVVPDNLEIYGNLADVYLEQQRYHEAELMYQKQLETNPENVWVYGKIAYCYRKNAKEDLLEDLFKKAIDANPESVQVPVWILELGFILQENNKPEEAQKVFQDLFLRLTSGQFSGSSADIYARLASYYESQGKKDLANQLINLRQKRLVKHDSPTMSNYQQLKEIVLKKGIKLICAQYPLRDIALLRKDLSSTGIIFVDNRAVFQDAVNKNGYDQYFYDRFAGDFGHCTAQGNKLLAENISKAILKNIK